MTHSFNPANAQLVELPTVVKSDITNGVDPIDVDTSLLSPRNPTTVVDRSETDGTRNHGDVGTRNPSTVDPNDGSDITTTGDNNTPPTDPSRPPRGNGSINIKDLVAEMIGDSSTDPDAYTSAITAILSTLFGRVSSFGDLGSIITSLQNAFSDNETLSKEDKVSLRTSIANMLSGVLTGLLNNEYNRQNWVMENAYNTPSAQLARLVEAGINPSYYFGSLNAGNASQIGDSSVSAGQMSFAHNQGTNPVEKAMTGVGALGSLVGSALGVAEAPSTIKGIIASANLAQQQADTMRQLTPAQLENFLAGSAASYAQARNLDSNTTTNEAVRPLTLAQMRENVANMRSNTEKMDTEAKLNKQQIDTNFLYQKRQAGANLALTESQTYLARVNAETLREGMAQRWAQMFQDKEIAQGNWSTSRYVADKSYASTVYSANKAAQSASNVANINGAWNYRINKVIQMTNRMNTLTMADVQREGNRVQFSLPFVNKLYDHVQTTWYVGADGSFHSAAEMQAKFPGIFKGGVNVETALAAKGFKQTTLEQNCFNLLKVKAVRDGINWYLSKSPDFNLDFAKLTDSHQMLVHLTNMAEKQYNLQLGNKIGYGMVDMMFNGTGQSSAKSSFLGSYSDIVK